MHAVSYTPWSPLGDLDRLWMAIEFERADAKGFAA
jgi:hypothetical protein